MFSWAKFVFPSLFLAAVLNFEPVNGDGITVTLYQHGFYRGTEREIYIENNKCFPLFGEWADEVSSIKLNSNCVQVYEGGNCDGKSEILDGNRPNSAATLNSRNLGNINFNDKVHSLRRC